jgi:aldehyde:ferredoxin oxidoreductase
VGRELLSPVDRIDPLSPEYKAELVASEQDWYSVVDSLGICFFATFALGHNQLTDLLYSLTGIDAFSSTAKLMRIGERIFTLTRLFNLREGMTGRDDTLPKRLLKEPLPAGPARGTTVPLQKLIDEYYLVRGWDETGRPTDTKLSELGLRKD